MIAMSIGGVGFLVFGAHLVLSSVASRKDDLRCPSSDVNYKARYRVARRVAGTVVIRRD